MRYAALGGSSKCSSSVRTIGFGQLAAISSRIARGEPRPTSSSRSASARFSTSSSSTINSELRVTRNWYAPLTCIPGNISATNSESTEDRKTKRSEEHTSELQSLMRISYAVFCLKKKTTTTRQIHTQRTHTHYK